VVEQLNETAQRALGRENVADILTAVFALYLEQYPVQITWHGRPLDPHPLQRARQELTLGVDGVATPIRLTIIEWNFQRNGLCISVTAPAHP